MSLALAFAVTACGTSDNDSSSDAPRATTAASASTATVSKPAAAQGPQATNCGMLPVDVLREDYPRGLRVLVVPKRSVSCAKARKMLRYFDSASSQAGGSSYVGEGPWQCLFIDVRPGMPQDAPIAHTSFDQVIRCDNGSESDLSGNHTAVDVFVWAYGVKD